MLRRFSTCMFALLLFALAFSIPHRSTAPPNITVVAALFRPHVAYAQATASAPGQTVADNPNAVAVVDAGPGVDTARAVAKNSSSSHAVLWGTLLVVALLIGGVWFRQRNKPYEYRGPSTGDSGERTRGGP